MTQDEIIRMAREAGLLAEDEAWVSPHQEAMERFAALVAEPWIETNKALSKEIIEMKKQAGQEPVAWWFQPPNKNVRPMFDTQQHGGKWQPLYAAPVRTKDLTDDEIMKINVDTASIVPTCDRQFHFARTVIAADRELNK